MTTTDTIEIGPIEDIKPAAVRRKSTVAIEDALRELKAEQSRTLPARFAAAARSAAKRLGIKVTVHPVTEQSVRVYRRA